MKYLISILLLLLSFFAVSPLLNQGFFPMHDDTQPARVFEMTKSLRAGMFPVRWVADLGYGYGYPIFNFYAPLPYYIGSLFMIIGFDAILSTKIMIITGIIFSGFSMYLLASEFWGKSGGLISALLYLYFPYHAVNIYVRGAVSEFWAYAFIPLVFWGFYKLFKEGKYRYIVISALSYSGLILSHNLTAMMVSPFLIALIAFFIMRNYKKKNFKNIANIIYAFFIGIFVSSFYWMPALLEMGNTNVESTIKGGANFRDHFVCLNQLWYSQWGYGGSTSTCFDGLSFMLGKMNILIVLLSIISFFIVLYKKKLNKKILTVFIFTFSGLLISVFLLLSEAKFIWEYIFPMKYFQYPWRFLNMIGFFMAFLGGGIILFSRQIIKNKIFILIEVVLLLALIIIMNTKFFTPQKIILREESYYTSEYALKWRISKISDEYLPKDFIKPKTAEEAIDNKTMFSFNETVIEKTANIISLASLFMLILGIIPWVNKKKHD